MKHPLLARKLAGYRYDKIYARRAGRVFIVTFLVSVLLLLWLHLGAGDRVPMAVMAVLLAVSLVLSAALGDYLGSRAAKRTVEGEADDARSRLRTDSDTG